MILAVEETCSNETGDKGRQWQTGSGVISQGQEFSSYLRYLTAYYDIIDTLPRLPIISFMFLHV